MTSAQDLSAVSATYRSRLRLPANGLGARLFSVAMCVRVPYFATVLPVVRVMEPGRCEVTAPISIVDSRGVEVVRAQITTWVTPKG